MLKVLNRYILKEILSYFLISVFTFTGVLFTVKILKFANLILNKGVAASQIGLVFLAIIPTFLEVAIPMAALLGVLLAIARFSGDSEIIVLRASGISITRLITPVLLFGIFTTLLCFGISMYARPWGHQTLSKSLFEIARTKSTAGLERGVFNKLGKLTLYADEIDHFSGRLVNVVIDDRRATKESNASDRKVVFAASGSIISNEENETITFNLKDGVIHEMNRSGEYVLTQFLSNKTIMHADEVFNPDVTEGVQEDRELTNQQLMAKSEKIKARLLELQSNNDTKTDSSDGLDLEIMNEKLAQHGLIQPSQKIADPFADLGIKELAKLGRGTEVEQARRLSFPFAALCMALLGLPLGIQTPRSQKTWGVGLSFVLGLSGFLVYFALLTVGVAAAEKGSLSATIGVWLPNIGTLFVGGLLMHLIGSELWQTVGEGLTPLVTAVVSPIRLVAGRLSGSSSQSKSTT
jgi:lipopolysaccharide export system permease protein